MIDRKAVKRMVCCPGTDEKCDSTQVVLDALLDVAEAADELRPACVLDQLQYVTSEQRRGCACNGCRFRALKRRLEAAIKVEIAEPIMRERDELRTRLEAAERVAESDFEASQKVLREVQRERDETRAELETELRAKLEQLEDLVSEDWIGTPDVFLGGRFRPDGLREELHTAVVDLRGTLASIATSVKQPRLSDYGYVIRAAQAALDRTAHLVVEAPVAD